MIESPETEALDEDDANIAEDGDGEFLDVPGEDEDVAE